MPYKLAKWAINTITNAPAVIAIKVHGIMRGPFSGLTFCLVRQADKAKTARLTLKAIQVGMRGRYMVFVPFC